MKRRSLIRIPPIPIPIPLYGHVNKKKKNTIRLSPFINLLQYEPLNLNPCAFNAHLPTHIFQFNLLNLGSDLYSRML
jgi:hypothetical protein